MAESDLERLSKIVLDEFKHVHERFDQIDLRFEAMDRRFDGIEARLTSVESEVRGIRRRLEALEESANNATGFTKEIDHLLRRVAMIEKHLGLQAHIKA